MLFNNKKKLQGNTCTNNVWYIVHVCKKKVVHEMTFSRCPNYNGLPPQCQLITDVNKPCCKKPYCNFQGVTIEVTNTPAPNMGTTIAPNPLNPTGPTLIPTPAPPGLPSMFLNLANTVESSLLVGDQCSWILWVTFVLEFTFPWMYMQALVWFLLKLHRLHFQWNYVPTKNFVTHDALTPMNKNNSMVHYFYHVIHWCS